MENDGPNHRAGKYRTWKWTNQNHMLEHIGHGKLRSNHMLESIGRGKRRIKSQAGKCIDSWKWFCLSFSIPSLVRHHFASPAFSRYCYFVVHHFPVLPIQCLQTICISSTRNKSLYLFKNYRYAMDRHQNKQTDRQTDSHKQALLKTISPRCTGSKHKMMKDGNYQISKTRTS